MLIAPINIELNKVVKRKTFNFDTTNKQYGNLVLIGTDNYDDYGHIVTSKLFKPQQLYSVFTPRKVKPLNRTFVTFFQKDIYASLREVTHGFLKIGKALESSYAGRNLVYNLVPDYSETYKLLSGIKKADPAQHIFMQEYFQNLINETTESIQYEKAYLIFPLTVYIDNFKNQIQVQNSPNHSPLIEFLKTLRFGTYNKEKFKNITRIIFYNPFAEAMVVMDPQDPEIVDHFLEYFTKINRLNNYNNKSDLLDDITDDSENETNDDIISNTKQEITKVVLANVAKKLKANLEDYDAATMTEKGIIASIDKKVDSYLSKEDGNKKSFAELVKEVETDKEVAAKAVNYIESKKIAEKQLIQLSKNLDKETDIINSIKDLDINDVKTFEPEKITAELPKIINEKVQRSSLNALDTQYNKVQYMQDLISCVASFSDQEILPLSIVDWKLTDSSDDFTLKDTLTVRYKTDENKVLSFKIDIPKIFDGHCLKIKGNTYVIQKQICRLPIVKTKENRVEIATNFNKITCERTNGHISRHNAYLKKILQRYKTNPAYQIEYGYNIELNSMYKNDFEYEELSSFLSKITSMQYEINTNRNEVEKEFNILSFPETFTITDTMTPLGFAFAGSNNKDLIYIEEGKVYKASVNIENLAEGVTIKQISDTLFDFIVRDVLHDDPNKVDTIGKSYIYTNCKFLSVVYPIFVLCGINVGLTTILNKAKIKYKVSATKLNLDTHWVEVQFKNKWLYYEDNLVNTLLLNILTSMHTTDWDFEDFDTDEPYVDYCVNTLGQPIYVRQTVRINISKFIDPITRDVLKYLKLPTDPIDLLLLASKMLTNNSFIPKNDLCNYRIRGNELISAMLYEIIAKAYYKYQNAKLNGSNKETLKINQNELISTILSQQNINVASQLNPVLEMESASSCSMKGFKGINLRDAYTTELRSYDKSMNGILSANSTPFSGAVGIQRSLTVNPKINHIRGFIPTIDQDSLDATNQLSASEILNFTTATRADAPRVAMQVGQTKHAVPTAVSHKQLIGSGYDHVLPYMISDSFCFKAKYDGIVESIDDKEHLAILLYNNNEHDAIDLKELLAKNSNSGFYINQTYSMKYKVGESFKAGDIIAYNPAFFTGRGNDCAYTPGVLSKIVIGAGDFCFEDSTYVSERLGEKAATDITMAKPVALGPNAIIHKIAKIGDHVDVNDELLNFTTSFNDPATSDFLQDLISSIGDEDAKTIGNEQILSKYAGRISDIDIYYNVPFETLNNSLQNLITEYEANILSRKDAIAKKNIHPAAIHLKPTGQQKETKINGTEFEGVLIIFYVTHKDTLSAGDKIIFGTALKGVVTKVATKDEAPRSQFRKDEVIDGCLAASGVPSRMTMDIFPMLYGNKCLIELGRWIHNEWNS